MHPASTGSALHRLPASARGLEKVQPPPLTCFFLSGRKIRQPVLRRPKRKKKFFFGFLGKSEKLLTFASRFNRKGVRPRKRATLQKKFFSF
ncbi:hypothetical protein KLP40_15765, partial [Hymenobacter sp. NST-14]|uniref:hypothetical protein n=1 Tax=Hymenobacter piscis TaxID=2839984 RepID=UPI001C01E524